MSACQLLLARPTTAGCWNAAFDRWFNLRNSARAHQRLGRNPLAGIAETKVAEVVALMLSTRQHFLALNDTKMQALRITGSPAELLFDRAANFFALVLVARFELLADNLALELIERLELVFRHQLLTLMLRIVDFVAADFHACLTAPTLVINLSLAAHAVSIMALFRALVLAAWKEAFAKCITGWNGFRAVLSLPTQKLFDAVVTTRAVEYLRRVSLAGRACATVAVFLTCMVAAIEFASTDKSTAELGFSAAELFAELTAVALLQ